MKKSKFTDEQIALALRQAEVGTPVAEVCRKVGCVGGDVLPLEAAVWWPWAVGAAQDAPARGREPQAEAACGGPVARQGHAPGSAGKKPSAWSAARDRPLGAGLLSSEGTAQQFRAPVRSQDAPLPVGPRRSGATEEQDQGDCRDAARYGYRRIHVLLRCEGWAVNVKRVRRLYRMEGLNLRAKRPRRHVMAYRTCYSKATR